ncbi:MAG: hypothetical protein ACREHG_01760 [Candidatus Saccharimonadales bacterium]
MLRQLYILYAAVLLLIGAVLLFGTEAIANQAMPMRASEVAVALQYVNGHTLAGANTVLDKQGNLVVFRNDFACRRWAMVEVSTQRNKTIGYACVPIPAGTSTRVLPDSSGIPTSLEDLALAFEYGTTNQLVKVVLLGQALDSPTCVKTGKDTLKSSASAILPGWKVVIQCLGVPPWPMATDSV